MKKTIKYLIGCLPVVVLLLLTVIVSTPSAQAAELRAPQLKAPVNTASGVKLSWSAVPKAEQYRVFVKKDASSWKKLIDTKSTSVIHKVAKPGVTYTYTVRCITKDGKRCIGDYNRTGKKITFLSPPTFKSPVNTAGGTILSWNAAKGAVTYQLYIKTSSGWKLLKKSGSTYYLHAAARENTSYSYKIRCVAADGSLSVFSPVRSHVNQRTSRLTNASFAYKVYSSAGKSYVTPSRPEARLTRQSAAAILVRALNYPKRALVSVSDSSDPALLTLVSYGCFIPDGLDRVFPNHYIIEDEYNAIMTDLYRYKQLKGKRALLLGDSIMKGAGNGNFSECRLIAEKYGMTCVSYAYNGATFSTCANNRMHIVNRIQAAYAKKCKADIIFLNGATNDIKLVAAGTTPDVFDPAHPEQSPFARGFEQAMTLIRQYWGNIPVIYVRAHNISSCPDVLEVPMGEYGVQIAEKYGAVTADVFSDTDFNTGNDYIRDRCTWFNPDVNRHDGTHPNGLGYITYYLPTVTKRLVFTPKLDTPTNVRDGVRISWSHVGDSPKYRVYLKNGNTYTKLADTTDRYYVHTTAVSGTKYTYTVRCLSPNGKILLSDFDTNGKSILCIRAPQLTLTDQYRSVKVSWGAVKGAAKYRVFIHTPTGWQTLTDTVGTTFVYAPCTPGEQCTFTVRCISADGKAFTSAAGEAQTITCSEPPQIASTENES